jgi:hypothetical protein
MRVIGGRLLVILVVGWNVAGCGEVPLRMDGGNGDANDQQVCTANSLSCADDALYQCDEHGGGTSKIQDCQYGCSNEACKECEADTTFCSADDLVMCSADGKITNPQSCENGCQMNRCNTCKPGVAYCDNANAITCGTDGTPGATTNCGAAGCIGGVCNTCQPNTTSCVGDTLVVCNASGKIQSTTACALGCGSTPNAHCKALVPLYGVPAPSGTLPDLVVDAHTTLNIAGCGNIPPSVSLIKGNVSTPITGAPQVDSVSQSGGGPPICVVRFNKITVQQGFNLVVLNSVTPGHALSLQATDDIQLAGTIAFTNSARGPSAAIEVEGIYTNGVVSPGAGGGGAARAGGNGGDCLSCSGATRPGGAGGATITTIANVLTGGSEGGSIWATILDRKRYFGIGGKGGGALHLVSLTRVSVASTGVINVNGKAGTGDPSELFFLGSGAGSGGTIVVEAPAISLSANAVAVANGAAGAGGCPVCSGFQCTSVAGESGQLTTARAKGGECGGASNGGWEANGVTSPSATGAATVSNPPAPKSGGGGGGSNGFIILRGRTANNVTFAGNVVVSPTATIGSVSAN